MDNPSPILRAVLASGATTPPGCVSAVPSGASPRHSPRPSTKHTPLPASSTPTHPPRVRDTVRATLAALPFPLSSSPGGGLPSLAALFPGVQSTLSTAPLLLPQPFLDTPRTLPRLPSPFLIHTLASPATTQSAPTPVPRGASTPTATATPTPRPFGSLPVLPPSSLSPRPAPPHRQGRPTPLVRRSAPSLIIAAATATATNTHPVVGPELTITSSHPATLHRAAREHPAPPPLPPPHPAAPSPPPPHRLVGLAPTPPPAGRASGPYAEPPGIEPDQSPVPLTPSDFPPPLPAGLPAGFVDVSLDSANNNNNNNQSMDSSTFSFLAQPPPTQPDSDPCRWSPALPYPGEPRQPQPPPGDSDTTSAALLPPSRGGGGSRAMLRHSPLLYVYIPPHPEEDDDDDTATAHRHPPLLYPACGTPPPGAVALPARDGDSPTSPPDSATATTVRPPQPWGENDEDLGAARQGQVHHHSSGGTSTIIMPTSPRGDTPRPGMPTSPREQQHLRTSMAQLPPTLLVTTRSPIPPACQWTPLETHGDAPRPRAGHRAWWTREGRLVVVGGYSHAESYLTEAHFYDPRTHLWTRATLRGTPPPVRYGHHCVYHPALNRLYFFGGLDASDPTNPVHTLDMRTLEWAEEDVTGVIHPPPVAWHQCFVLEPHPGFFVFGGMTADGRPVNALYYYDPVSHAWFDLAQAGTVPSPRAYHTCVPVPGGGLLLFGGEDDRRRILNDLVFLHGASMTWVPVLTSGTVPHGRDGAAFWVQAGALWVHGGWDFRARNQADMYRLDLATFHWEAVGSAPAAVGPCARSYHQCAVDPEGMVYMVGGWTGRNRYANDLWRERTPAAALYANACSRIPASMREMFPRSPPTTPNALLSLPFHAHYPTPPETPTSPHPNPPLPKLRAIPSPAPPPMLSPLVAVGRSPQVIPVQIAPGRRRPEASPARRLAVGRGTLGAMQKELLEAESVVQQIHSAENFAGSFELRLPSLTSLTSRAFLNLPAAAFKSQGPKDHPQTTNFGFSGSSGSIMDPVRVFMALFDYRRLRDDEIDDIKEGDVLISPPQVPNPERVQVRSLTLPRKSGFIPLSMLSELSDPQEVLKYRRQYQSSIVPNFPKLSELMAALPGNTPSPPSSGNATAVPAHTPSVASLAISECILPTGTGGGDESARAAARHPIMSWCRSLPPEGPCTEQDIGTLVSLFRHPLFFSDPAISTPLVEAFVRLTPANAAAFGRAGMGVALTAMVAHEGTMRRHGDYVMRGMLALAESQVRLRAQLGRGPVVGMLVRRLAECVPPAGPLPPGPTASPPPVGAACCSPMIVQLLAALATLTTTNEPMRVGLAQAGVAAPMAQLIAKSGSGADVGHAALQMLYSAVTALTDGEAGRGAFAPPISTPPHLVTSLVPVHPPSPPTSASAPRSQGAPPRLATSPVPPPGHPESPVLGWLDVDWATAGSPRDLREAIVQQQADAVFRALVSVLSHPALPHHPALAEAALGAIRNLTANAPALQSRLCEVPGLVPALCALLPALADAPGLPGARHTQMVGPSPAARPGRHSASTYLCIDPYTHTLAPLRHYLAICINLTGQPACLLRFDGTPLPPLVVLFLQRPKHTSGHPGVFLLLLQLLSNLTVSASICSTLRAHGVLPTLIALLRPLFVTPPAVAEPLYTCLDRLARTAAGRVELVQAEITERLARIRPTVPPAGPAREAFERVWEIFARGQPGSNPGDPGQNGAPTPPEGGPG
ncbi:putative rho GTPase-activating protein gacHH [Paratrimastix pyriformis]|uniref:Rho GTPase-activating protein gacHH n=1 Tax=Paratrimastix pyriformis TaxID=342808 RepID=A0ABQ8US23_9EUKA|nr:putative rho GTPase-activating protein gacHH [Paratrimastix pyriformis]